MSEFLQKANKAVGENVVKSMVERDIKYKKDARLRQLITIVLLVFLIFIFSFFSYLLLQNLDAMNKIINNISNVIQKN